MKHLRRFNESLLSETISDICLDLEDEGYYTSVSPESEHRKHIQKLRITKSNDRHISDLSLGFRCSDIKDTLDRIYTVLGENLLSTSIRLYNTTESYYEVKMIDEISNKVKIYGLEIRFFQPGDYSHNESKHQDDEVDLNEIGQSIKDMLLDVSDDYYVDFVFAEENSSTPYKYCIIISTFDTLEVGGLSKRNTLERIEWNKISSTIHRIENYLNDSFGYAHLDWEIYVDKRDRFDVSDNLSDLDRENPFSVEFQLQVDVHPA